MKAPTASLHRGKTLPAKCPGYDNELSDDEAPVLELTEMLSMPSLLLLSGPLRLEMVVPIRVMSIGQT